MFTTTLEYVLAAAALAGLAGSAVFGGLYLRERRRRPAEPHPEPQPEPLRRGRFPGEGLDELMVTRHQLQACIVALAFLLKARGVPLNASLRARMGILLGLWLQGFTLTQMSELLARSFSTVDRLVRTHVEYGILPPGHRGLERFERVPPEQAGGDAELCVLDPGQLRPGSLNNAWTRMLFGE